MLRGPTSSVLLPIYLSAATLKTDVATQIKIPPSLGSFLATFDRFGLWSASGVQLFMLQSKAEFYRKMELALCGGSL